MTMEPNPRKATSPREQARQVRKAAGTLKEIERQEQAERAARVAELEADWKEHENG